MRINLCCLAVLTLLIQAIPGTCQDTATNTAKHTGNTAKAKVKEAKRHHGAKTEKIKQKTLEIPTGSPVKVESTDGTRMQGTLANVTNEGIGIRSGKGPVQNVAYGDIRSLKKTRGPRLGPNGLPDTGKLNASLGNIPQGSAVNVKLANKSKLSGRYLGKEADSVRIQTPQDGKMVTQTIPEDQIASVHADKPGLFSKPRFQPPDLVKKTVSAVPVGSPMDIKTPDGKNVPGKLTGVTDDGFSLQALEGDNLVNKDLPYDQVASVKRPGGGIRQAIPGLHPPALQSAPQIRKAAMDVPAGSVVTLLMPNGNKTTGRLMGVTNDGMQVQSLKAGDVVTQNVGFDQIGSIKQGVPVSPTDRAKKYAVATVMVVVTGAISGALARGF
jgi:hypothetical protein